jgi:hypothetical protein
VQSESRDNEGNPLLAMAGWLKDNPLLADWQNAIQEYRRQCDVHEGIETNRPDTNPRGGRLLAAICEIDFQLGETYARQEIGLTRDERVVHQKKRAHPSRGRFQRCAAI